MPHILSLDDGTDWLEIYRLILEPAGYDYTGTNDEQEALSILHNLSGRFKPSTDF